jgi:uncharacterized protein (DUF1778 family)
MAGLAMKNERLALRLTRPQRRLIERAAVVQGESLTEFSVSAAVDKAERVLVEQNEWMLDAADWDAFVSAIDHPGRVLPGLAELMRQPTVFTE